MIVGSEAASSILKPDASLKVFFSSAGVRAPGLLKSIGLAFWPIKPMAPNISVPNDKKTILNFMIAPVCSRLL